MLPEQLLRGGMQDIVSTCSCEAEHGYLERKLSFLHVEPGLGICGCNICVPYRWALNGNSAHSAVGYTISTHLS